MSLQPEVVVSLVCSWFTLTVTLTNSWKSLLLRGGEIDSSNVSSDFSSLCRSRTLQRPCAVSYNIEGGVKNWSISLTQSLSAMKTEFMNMSHKDWRWNTAFDEDHFKHVHTELTILYCISDKPYQWKHTRTTWLIQKIFRKCFHEHSMTHPWSGRRTSEAPSVLSGGFPDMPVLSPACTGHPRRRQVTGVVNKAWCAPLLDSHCSSRWSALCCVAAGWDNAAFPLCCMWWMVDMEVIYVQRWSELILEEVRPQTEQHKSLHTTPWTHTNVDFTVQGCN